MSVTLGKLWNMSMSVRDEDLSKVRILIFADNESAQESYRVTFQQLMTLIKKELAEEDKK